MRVSAIIAAFRSPFLSETLASIQRQHLKAFEAIVVDDDPEHSAREIVAALGDPRFRWIPTSGRSGPAVAHQIGLLHATAEYAAVLNHDDVWHDDFLWRAVAALDGAPGSVLAFSDHGVINEAGVRIPEQAESLRVAFGRSSLTPGVRNDFASLVMNGSVSIAQAAVFRRAALPPIPPRMGQVYDRWIAVALAESRRSAVYLDEELAMWRQHGGSLTAEGPSFDNVRAVAALDRYIIRRRMFRTATQLRRTTISQLHLLTSWSRQRGSNITS